MKTIYTNTFPRPSNTTTTIQQEEHAVAHENLSHTSKDFLGGVCRDTIYHRISLTRPRGFIFDNLPHCFGQARSQDILIALV